MKRVAQIMRDTLAITCLILVCLLWFAPPGWADGLVSDGDAGGPPPSAGASTVGPAASGPANRSGSTGQAGSATSNSTDRQTKRVSPTDVVVVLDNSGSMRVNDPTFLTRRLVSEFPSRLPAGSRLELVLVDSEVKVTLDFAPVDAPDFAARVERGLSQLTYKGQRTDLPAAVEHALYDLRNGGRADAARFVVLLSDGIVDLGNSAKDREQVAWLQDHLAPYAKGLGVRIFGVTFAPTANFQILQSLAHATDGDYFRAFGPSHISAVFDQIARRIENAASTNDEPSEDPAARTDVTAAPLAQTVAAVESAAEAAGNAAKAADTTATAASTAAAAAQSAAGAADNAAAAANNTAAAADTTSGAAQMAAGAAEKAASAAEKTAAAADRVATWVDTPLLARLVPPLDKRTMLVGGIGSGLLLIGLGAAVVAMLRRPKRPIPVIVSESIGSDIVPEAELRGVAPGVGTFVIEKAVTRIGRAAGINDVVLPTATVSAQHAVIEFRKGLFYLRDLRSKNGSFVNGRQIGDTDRREMREVTIKNRDRIRFDGHEFEFVLAALEDSDETRVLPFDSAEYLRAQRNEHPTYAATGS